MQRPLRPMHALLLAGMVPPFLGALLSDIAYLQSYEVQWKNFASWLIVGGLFFCGFALLWALVEKIRNGRRARETVAYFCLLLAILVVGFINAFVHAGDAWASMPEGVILSAVVIVMVMAATWLGKVASTIRPDYSLGSHVAALGVAFSSPAIGPRFADGVFVGEHGSWNRGVPVGYKVVFVPFLNGRPTGRPIDFVTGFQVDGLTHGRPVGVSVDPRGALIVADDLSNTIWRVRPVSQAPASPGTAHATPPE